MYVYIYIYLFFVSVCVFYRSISKIQKVAKGSKKKKKNIQHMMYVHIDLCVCTSISGWWFQSLRKILVNWDDYSQNLGQ